MNISETQCVNCPAKQACRKPQVMPDGELRMQTCPPQNRTVRVYAATEPIKPTMSDIKAKSEFSELQKEMYVIYHCPRSEKRKFIDPLKERIHPSRSEYFKTGSSPSSGVAGAHQVEQNADTKKYFADLRRSTRGKRTVGR